MGTIGQWCVACCLALSMTALSAAEFTSQQRDDAAASQYASGIDVGLLGGSCDPGPTPIDPPFLLQTTDTDDSSASSIGGTPCQAAFWGTTQSKDGVIDLYWVAIADTEYYELQEYGSQGTSQWTISGGTTSTTVYRPNGTYDFSLRACTSGDALTGGAMLMSAPPSCTSVGTVHSVVQITSTGTLGATPSPCVLSSEGRCTTTVTWQSSSAPHACVFAKPINSSQRTMLSCSVQGTYAYENVGDPGVTFELRAASDPTAHLIATTSVNGIYSPAASLSAEPQQVVSGGTSVLTWSSQHALSCTLNNAPVSLSGQQTTPSLTTTTDYRLACTGAGGSVERTVTIVVGAGPQVGWSQWANLGACENGEQTQIRVCQLENGACQGEYRRVIACVDTGSCTVED